MLDPNKSFGQKLLMTSSLKDMLSLEHELGKQSLFASLDNLLTKLMVKGLQGYRIVQIDRAELVEDKIKFLNITGAEQEFLFTCFGLQNQQSRGAWYLPDRAKIRPGLLNLSAYFLEFSYLAGNTAYEENTEVTLANSPEALLIWAVLEPLISGILAPLELRGQFSGSKSQDYMGQAWQLLDQLLQALGFTLELELTPFRNGKNWHNLDTPGQLEAKRCLLTSIAYQVRPDMFPLYRVYRIHQMVEQYYNKAKNKGVAKRKQVVTKALEPTLSGFFGGFWLQFLEYIEENAHPDEEILGSLPETRLYTGGVAKAAEVASELGLSIEDIALITGSYWQQTSGASPIEERVSLFKGYWTIFDQIHLLQNPGMPSLWGLIEDYRLLHWEHGNNDIYHAHLYRQLLPAEMNSRIERLWGSTMLARYPENIVTEPYPHWLMAETFGPALKFWHGCSLTAWFICEGPSSRTDIPGLLEYYRREIAALSEMGTPLDPQLFAELIAAEKRLGPETPIEDKSNTLEKGLFSITITSYRGNRRSGFELLRDIISRYRKNWAAQYLDSYLNYLWENELKEATRKYQQLLHDRAKPPTLKQFAKTAEYCTNHWFGGDISLFYAAIGEKCPAQPGDSRLLNINPADFATSIFAELKNHSIKLSKSKQLIEQGNTEDTRNLERLAELSFYYLQLKEATGKVPTLKEVGTGKFEWYASDLDSDVSVAWEKYVNIVESVFYKVTTK